jgi:hypothetical protein
MLQLSHNPLQKRLESVIFHLLTETRLVDQRWVSDLSRSLACSRSRSLSLPFSLSRTRLLAYSHHWPTHTHSLSHLLALIYSPPRLHTPSPVLAYLASTPTTSSTRTAGRTTSRQALFTVLAFDSVLVVRELAYAARIAFVVVVIP